MHPLESKRLVEATELFDEIRNLIGEKRVVIATNGQVTTSGYDPDYLDDVLDIKITDFLKIIADLENIGTPEILEVALKKFSEKLSKISIEDLTKPKNKNFTPEVLAQVNRFRKVQRSAKIDVLHLLQKDKHYKFRGQQMIWLGSQKELVELFRKLYELKWIGGENAIAAKCLPIIESFKIIKEGNVIEINEESFIQAWKNYDTTILNSDKYKKKFAELTKKPQ